MASAAAYPLCELHDISGLGGLETRGAESKLLQGDEFGGRGAHSRNCSFEHFSLDPKLPAMRDGGREDCKGRV